MADKPTGCQSSKLITHLKLLNGIRGKCQIKLNPALYWSVLYQQTSITPTCLDVGKLELPSANQLKHGQSAATDVGDKQ